MHRTSLVQVTETCTIAIHRQQCTTIQLKDVANRYGMRLNGVMLEGTKMICFCEMRRKSYLSHNLEVSPLPLKSSEDVVMAGNPSSSLPSQAAAPNPWSVNINDMLDSIDVGREELKETPIAWLMNKGFSSKFTTYHVMLKVSPSFMGGRLHNQFVSTACPDPFLGLNGPALKGCVVVFCLSNGTGAAIQHYHIPATDLSPAPRTKRTNSVLFWMEVIVVLFTM
ncbi:hypothetical protein EV424DRAFT_1345553 [Suillus variegatus]|nr:hypothetical protein EV424DRAFT_1345553 [Suillus variegatus]